MAKRNYISASAINLFLTCPTSYFLKYELGLDKDLTDETYAKFGTLFHNISENIANNEYLFIDEAIEEYENGFANTGVDVKSYYESGIEGIKHVWEFFEDWKIKVIGAEVEFNVKPFEDILPLFGFIDLVYKNENGKLVVRDYKTGKPYNEKQMMKQIQPYFYAEACLGIYGELPSFFEFYFPRYNETRTVVIDEEFMEFNRIKMKGIWKQIQNTVLKANWSPFFCEHFCNVRSNCPLYQSKRG